MKGGPASYDAGQAWQVDDVRAVRVRNGEVEYYVKWKGYDATFNTWESVDDVSDKLIDDFHEPRLVTVDSTQAEHDISETLAVALLKTKLPKTEFSVEIPSASYPAVAHALLARASRTPSRAGKKPLKVELDVGYDRQTSEVQLDELQDIGFFSQLETVRPDKMFDALVWKKGRASAHDMLVLGPPGVVRCASSCGVRATHPSRAAPCDATV